MYNRNKFFNGLTLLILILVQSGCGKAGGSGISSTTPSPTKVETFYKVGDVVQLQDRTITLNSVAFYKNGRQANFTIENKGSEGFYVTPALFSAQDGEGRQLPEEIMEEVFNSSCGPALVGQVLPGQILKGNICWKGATVYPVNKIYYHAVVWEVSGRPGAPIPYSKAENYKVGDVIQLQDQTITLKNVLFYNNGLQTSVIANFVIENRGSDVLYVNSDLFIADDSEGNGLEQELGCGLEGEVLPGHILQFSLCWNGVTTHPVRIFYYIAPYTPDLIVVMWEAKK
jgi:hypothetical protein